jgi:hypothetical protein
MYFLYYSHIGQWTKPPKGTTRAQLTACYRRVRQMDESGRVLASWVDGKRNPPKQRSV